MNKIILMGRLTKDPEERIRLLHDSVLQWIKSTKEMMELQRISFRW